MTIIKKRGKNIKFKSINIESEIKNKNGISIKEPSLIPSSYILHLKPQKIMHSSDNQENIECDNLNYDMLKYDPQLTTPTPFFPTDNTGFSNQYSFLSTNIEKDSQSELCDSKTDKILNLPEE